MAHGVGEIQYSLNEWVGIGGQWNCPEHLTTHMQYYEFFEKKANREPYNYSYGHQLGIASINYIFIYLIKRTKEKATLEQPTFCLTFLSDYSILTHSNISSKLVCAIAHTDWETLHPGLTHAL